MNESLKPSRSEDGNSKRDKSAAGLASLLKDREAREAAVAAESGDAAAQRELARLAVAVGPDTLTTGKAEKTKKRRKKRNEQAEPAVSVPVPGVPAEVLVTDESGDDDKPVDEVSAAEQAESTAGEELPEIDLSPTAFVGDTVIELRSDAKVVQPATEQPGDTVASGLVMEEVPFASLRLQPEQQHQARDEQPELPQPQEPSREEPPQEPGLPPAQTPEGLRPPQESETSRPLAGAGAGGGNVPPTVPPEFFAAATPQPEEPENVFAVSPRPRDYGERAQEPAQIYHEYVRREASAAQESVPPAAAEGLYTQRELDDAAYAARRGGVAAGAGAGLAVAAYEHFKHKRREKKAEKRFRTQTKQLQEARRSYDFGVQEQEKQQVRTETRLKETERRSAAAEQAAIRAREQQPPEQLVVPAEHDVRLSAWLATEVDKNTGRVVETPAFTYGHEYYHERAQETAPAQQRNAAAGGVVLTGLGNTAGVAGPATTPGGAGTGTGGMAGTSPGSDTSLPPVQIPDATTQGRPAAGRAGTTTNKKTNPSTTLIWPWLVALAVIVICLIVLLG